MQEDETLNMARSLLNKIIAGNFIEAFHCLRKLKKNLTLRIREERKVQDEKDKGFKDYLSRIIRSRDE